MIEGHEMKNFNSIGVIVIRYYQVTITNSHTTNKTNPCETKGIAIVQLRLVAERIIRMTRAGPANGTPISNGARQVAFPAPADLAF